MALPPVGREEFLKRLGVIGATRSASAVNSARANSKAPVDALQALIDQKKSSEPQGLGTKILSTALKPLIVLDTPRRAIISGVREIADVLDTDTSTNASFSDFKNQALDPTYGFGTAFPMKGFMGRAIGFIGDVVLDPLTYATFGGTVAKKALTSGGVSTRAALGVKNVTGRQGRLALAKLSRERLNDMASKGMRFKADEINTIVRDIAARGKGEMPGFLRDDIGIKGPGIYYFGSRIKVKGSGVIGDFVERKLITPSRLALVNPKFKLNPGQYVHRAITPDGSYQIAYVDPDAVKRYRVGLANGTLSAKEAELGMGLLDMTDKQRLITAKALENGTQKAFDVVADPAMDTYKTTLHNFIETGTGVAADDRRFFVLNKLQKLFDDLYDDVNNDFKLLDDTFVIGERRNYVPHMESDQAVIAKIRAGESAWDARVSGKAIDDTARTASSFRGRKFTDGDIFFGHKLVGDNTTIDQMNIMARTPGPELNPTTGRLFDPIDYDFYETDMTKIVNKYIRHYSQQKGLAGFMRTGVEKGPGFMKRIRADIPIAGEFAMRRAAALPAELASVGPIIDNITTALDSAVRASRPSAALVGKNPFATPEAISASRILLNEPRTQMDQLGNTIKTFGENFETIPPVYQKVIERYDELSDRLNAQMSDNYIGRLLEAEADIDFIEKFNDDLSLFARDFEQTMKTNNYTFKPDSSEVVYPKWYSKDTPKQRAINLATNGDVESIDGLFPVIRDFTNSTKLDAPTVTSFGVKPSRKQLESIEQSAKEFRSRLSQETGLNRRIRIANEKFEAAQEIAVLKSKSKYAKNSIITSIKNFTLNPFQRVESIVSPQQRVVRTVEAGFESENLVHYAASLAEIKKIIAEAKRLGYGFIPGEAYVDEVLKRNIAPYLRNAQASLGRVERLRSGLVALRNNTDIKNTLLQIDELFGEQNVVAKFLKNNIELDPTIPVLKKVKEANEKIIRTLKDPADTKITAKDIETYLTYQLGNVLDDGILTRQTKLYTDRIKALETTGFGREVNDELFPIHNRKTLNQLNNELNEKPAIVRHTEEVKKEPKPSVTQQRAKELKDLPTVLQQEFKGYIKQQKQKAANFRKRIREQVVPKARKAEQELDEFLAMHEKASLDFVKEIIDRSTRIKDVKNFSVEAYLRQQVGKYFPNAAGFFDSFVLANKGTFDFLEDIATNSKRGVMSDFDFRIGLAVLQKNYAARTGVFKTKSFDKIFDEFSKGPKDISVTYENFVDITTHTLGVKFFDDVDNAVMPTVIDLETRVATQQDYILRLTRRAVSAEREVLEATPNNVFRRNRNRLAPLASDDITEATVRQVSPITGEIRDFPVAQAKQAELEESEYYPFAKSVEKRANTLLALRGFDGDKVDWTLGGRTELLYNGQPIAMTTTRWNTLMQPQKLDVLPGDEIDFILSWLKQDDVKQIVLGEDFAKTAGNISDEELLQSFAGYVYKNQPTAIVSDSSARYNTVQGLWDKSDAGKFLSEINRLKKLTADNLAAKQALDPVRAVDSVMTESNAIATRRATESIRAEEWVNNYGVDANPEVAELVRLQKELIEKLDYEFEPFTAQNRPSKFNPKISKDVSVKPVTDIRQDTGAGYDRVVGGTMLRAPESSQVDLEYVALLKMGIPRDILDGPLDGLNNWMRQNAKESSGLVPKIEIQKDYVDNILNVSDEELVQRSTAQIVQELDIIRTLQENNITTKFTNGKLNRLRRVRQTILNTRDPEDVVAKPINPIGDPRVERMVNPPPDPEYIGQESMLDKADFFYSEGTGGSVQEAMSGNPAGTEFYDELAKRQEISAERLPNSSSQSKRQVSVVEPRYEYNPDLSYSEQLGYGYTDQPGVPGVRRVEQREVLRETETGKLEKKTFNVDVGTRTARQTSLTPIDDVVEIPNYDNIETVLADALGLSAEKPKDLEEIVLAKFSSNYDAVSASVARARMDAATKPGAAKIAADVNTVDSAALEQIDNAQRVLIKVEQTGTATPMEQVIIDAGVKQAEILSVVSTKTTEEVEGMLMNGMAERIPPMRFLLPDGTVVDRPFPDTGTIIRETLTDGWVRLNGKFKGIEVTPEFKELWTNAKYFEDPAIMRQLTNYLGGFTKFHKAYATLTPGFHVRNLIGNSFQYILAGGRIENLKPATKIHFDWLAAYKRGDSWKKFLSTLDPADAEAATIARNAMLGSGGGIYGDVFHEVVRGNKIYDNRLTRFSRKYGQMSDNMSRFILGFDAAKQGMSSDMATARVRKFYFDYEDLSKLDRTMKQFVPFWIWSSRNLPLQLENMWLNPKPYQIYNSFVRNVRDKESEKRSPLPAFLQEVEAFKIPGMDAYAAPDLNFTKIQQQLSQLANPKKFGTNLNPLFRVPAEQVIGQNLYNDQEINTANERLVNLLQGLVVPVATGDRLLNSYGDAKINAWLGIFGSPVRKIKEK